MAKMIENFANLEPEEGKKVLLNLRHVDVQFNVRGRTLNAIRDVSFKLYEGETLAIVGESGSGKSVLTKTFAGMLDSNGIISHGKIFFHDEQLEETTYKMDPLNKKIYDFYLKKITNYSHLVGISDIYKQLLLAKKEYDMETGLTDEEYESFEKRFKKINDDIIDAKNLLQTLDKRILEEKVKIEPTKVKIKNLEEYLVSVKQERKDLLAVRKLEAEKNNAHLIEIKNDIANLQQEYNDKLAEAKAAPISDEQKHQNEVLVNEAMLSFGRYPLMTKLKFFRKWAKKVKDVMVVGKDVTSSKVLDKIYNGITFRCDYTETLEDGTLKGKVIIDCAQVKFTKDWQKIRGCKIATVFQDPMTSLNPIIPIGRQIMTVIMKHQKCSEAEAKERAISMMDKVGIPQPDKRFDDYPFQYSGGMRQRIVIAIALSCQPKILICDEPTTALDVTIQAQIIRLIKQLSKDLGFTTVFITHDLGVVANVADRVAVLYGGQIVELGNVEDVFFEPAHPYTWALLSSLPQLSQRGDELFSISGTPPSLYNKIVGDAFAPRSQYAMAIDYVKEPPMFEINSHHWAKTWLLDDRSPKVEKPAIIENLHEKMCEVYKNKI